MRSSTTWPGEIAYRVRSLSFDAPPTGARTVSPYPPAEYLRPWKLFTLAAGIALLVIGARMDIAPDWDVPISFIMALLAYLTAPWSLRVLLERRWRLLPLALLATWLTVDGCYALYWQAVDPRVLPLMRAWNFPASLALYGLCGVLWLYRGSLRELAAAMGLAVNGVRRRPGDFGP
jgi:hypothetical protein